MTLMMMMMMTKPNSLALYVSMRISAGYCPCWDASWQWLCLMLVEASLRSVSESLPIEDPPLVELVLMFPLPNPAALPIVRCVPALLVLPLLQTHSYSRSPRASPASTQFLRLLSCIFSLCSMSHCRWFACFILGDLTEKKMYDYLLMLFRSSLLPNEKKKTAQCQVVMWKKIDTK